MSISESKLKKIIHQIIKESNDQESLDLKFKQVLASKIDLESLIKTTIVDTNKEFYENIYARVFFSKYEETFGEILTYEQRSNIRKLLRKLMKDVLDGKYR